MFELAQNDMAGPKVHHHVPSVAIREGCGEVYELTAEHFFNRKGREEGAGVRLQFKLCTSWKSFFVGLGESKRDGDQTCKAVQRPGADQ